MTIEKNDVDINKLFSWGTVYEIVDGNNEVQAKVYMRLLGDADTNKARVYALRKSHELRKALKDLDSTERLIYIRPIEELELEDIVNYIVVFSMREITNRAYKEVKVKKPAQPKSDASLEKMEKYQEEIDQYPIKLKEAVEKYMKKGVDELKESLKTSTKEELYKRYENALIGEFCEQEAIRAYKDMELYMACYKDENYKERFFSSFEEFDNLDTQVKMDFRAAFDRIEVGMDELKKLREATQ